MTVCGFLDKEPQINADSRMKSTDRNVSVIFKVHPCFLYDMYFQNYDALRHESTPINYILPLEGV